MIYSNNVNVFCSRLTITLPRSQEITIKIKPIPITYSKQQSHKRRERWQNVSTNQVYKNSLRMFRRCCIKDAFRTEASRSLCYFSEQAVSHCWWFVKTRTCC